MISRDSVFWSKFWDFWNFDPHQKAFSNEKRAKNPKISKISTFFSSDGIETRTLYRPLLTTNSMKYVILRYSLSLRKFSKNWNFLPFKRPFTWANSVKISKISIKRHWARLTSMHWHGLYLTHFPKIRHSQRSLKVARKPSKRNLKGLGSV